MDLTLALWLLGGQSTIILTLLGVMWRGMSSRLEEIESEIDELSKKTEFSSFRAMDEAREKAWNVWRLQLEHRLDDHSERLKSHTQGIARIEGQLSGGR